MTYEEIQNLKPGDMLNVRESVSYVHREIVVAVDEIYLTTVGRPSYLDTLYSNDAAILTEKVVQKTYPIYKIQNDIEKVNIQWD